LVLGRAPCHLTHFVVATCVVESAVINNAYDVAFVDFSTPSIEVVGNIYENPERLGGIHF
jgi:hypothetical protein